jgi:hypothetical protein
VAAEDLTEMRVNVLVGFPLGGLLAIAIQAVAFQSSSTPTSRSNTLPRPCCPLDLPSANPVW